MAKLSSRVLAILLAALLIVIAGGLTLQFSCAPSPSVKLAKMDIIGATHLFIAPGSGNKLFKITEAGYVQEVIYKDENGKKVTTVEEPVAIYDVNSEYVIVCFGEDNTNITEGYLVRKTDGSVFSLGNAGFPIPQSVREFYGCRNWYFENAEAVFTDSSGNIYYLAQGVGGTEIIKLDTQSMDSITKTRYSPSGDNVVHFVVDKDGNAAYFGCPEGDCGRLFTRIRTAQGSIYDDVFRSTYFWLGGDGVIYCGSFESQPVPEVVPEVMICHIDKCSINATTGALTKSDYSVFEFEGDFGIRECYRLELQDRVLFAQTTPALPSQIFEVYNPTNSTRSLNITAFDLLDMYSAVASGNFYYLHGSNSSSDSVLVKVDPTDDSYEVLLSTNEYYIYTMSTSTADELIFNALRMSDGVTIIGKFDASGNLTILDEELNAQMVVLERIQ